MTILISDFSLFLQARTHETALLRMLEFEIIAVLVCGERFDVFTSCG